MIRGDSVVFCFVLYRGFRSFSCGYEGRGDELERGGYRYIGLRLSRVLRI